MVEVPGDHCVVAHAGVAADVGFSVHVGIVEQPGVTQGDHVVDV